MTSIPAESCGGASQSSAILKAFEGALKRFVAPTGVAQIITVKVRFVQGGFLHNI
jgi:hypothetical protein